MSNDNIDEKLAESWTAARVRISVTQHYEAELFLPADATPATLLQTIIESTKGIKGKPWIPTANFVKAGEPAMTALDVEPIVFYGDDGDLTFEAGDCLTRTELDDMCENWDCGDIVIAYIPSPWRGNPTGHRNAYDIPRRYLARQEGTTPEENS